MVVMAKADMEETDRESEAVVPVQDVSESVKAADNVDTDVLGFTTLFEEKVTLLRMDSTDESAENIDGGRSSQSGDEEEGEVLSLDMLFEEEYEADAKFPDEHFDSDALPSLFDSESNRKYSNCFNNEHVSNIFSDEHFDSDDLPSLFDCENNKKYSNRFYDEHFNHDDLPNLFDRILKMGRVVNALEVQLCENESRSSQKTKEVESDSDSDLDYLHLFSDNEDDKADRKTKSKVRQKKTPPKSQTWLKKKAAANNKPATPKTKVEPPRYTTITQGDYYDADVISRINSKVFRCECSTAGSDCQMCAMGTVQARADTDDTCCICLDTHTEPQVLPRCSHKFCRECIEAQFRIKPVCPVCFTCYGVITGIQPKGDMRHNVDNSVHLPGYEAYGTIVVSYYFPNGVQTAEHPHPGVSYTGTSRTGYLPDSPEGRRVLRLLEESFKRRLTFTVGRSRTTGAENTVTWNDIHHKTSTNGGMPSFGYPDPTYLSRVQEELAAVGVTEESLNAFSNNQ